MASAPALGAPLCGFRAARHEATVVYRATAEIGTYNHAAMLDYNFGTFLFWSVLVKLGTMGLDFNGSGLSLCKLKYLSKCTTGSSTTHTAAMMMLLGRSSAFLGKESTTGRSHVSSDALK